MKTQERGDQATCSEPEDETVRLIVVEEGRPPIEEPVVREIAATTVPLMCAAADPPLAEATRV
jgi:hypothetical protein